MSLDVYLIGKEKRVPCECSQCGHKHSKIETEEYYWANITHNLSRMASEAGIYEALWRPHRLKDGYNIPEDDYEAEYEFEYENPSFARDIIRKLTIGLDLLKRDPEHFKKFNSENGWGLYENFVPFVEEYLRACQEYPDAQIMVSR